MCFSISASIAAAAILIPAGVFAITEALRRDKRYFLLAAMPLAFGLQQLFEGLVWYGLLHHYDDFARQAALTYLFMAYFWWPATIPPSLYFLESKPQRKKIYIVLTIAGFLLGTGLYLPILLNPDMLDTEILGHSINYVTYTDTIIRHVGLFLYVALMLSAFSLSTSKDLKYFGIVLLITVLISLGWYLYAFTSVWCFFAAIMSIYIAYIVHKLPVRKKRILNR